MLPRRYAACALEHCASPINSRCPVTLGGWSSPCRSPSPHPSGPRRAARARAGGRADPRRARASAGTGSRRSGRSLARWTEPAAWPCPARHRAIARPVPGRCGGRTRHHAASLVNTLGPDPGGEAAWHSATPVRRAAKNASHSQGRMPSEPVAVAIRACSCSVSSGPPMPDARRICWPRTSLRRASRRRTLGGEASGAGVCGRQVSFERGPADGQPAAAGDGGRLGRSQRGMRGRSRSSGSCLSDLAGSAGPGPVSVPWGRWP